MHIHASEPTHARSCMTEQIIHRPWSTYVCNECLGGSVAIQQAVQASVLDRQQSMFLEVGRG